MRLEIRPLTTQEELEGCIELQQQVWGLKDSERTSPITLRALTISSPKTGLLLGAFLNKKLIGFSLTLGSLESGIAYGHMLGVLPEHQNLGVGRRIQLAVQETLRKNNITQMHWTFEPLESRNSYIYLNKLGGVATAYEQNFYHVEEAQQQSMPLDRMVLSLDLCSKHTPSKKILIHDALNKFPVATPDFMPEAPQVLVEIPVDFINLSKTLPQKALQIRLESRSVFTEYITHRGYKAIHLINGHAQEAESSYYILKKDV